MWYKKKKKKNDDLPLFMSSGIKVKKAPDYKAKLDRVFSQYIRLRDSKPYGYKYFKCISCGQIKPYEQADCGHYINRQHMATRFDEMNCHGQCRSCNRFDEGNMQGYRTGLVKLYGENKVQLLESKKYTSVKISPYEYRELIKYYTALVNRMKSELGK